MTHVYTSGPLFDGVAAHEMHAAVEAAVDEVGRQAYADVMTKLDESIRHPTPYYEVQINVKKEDLVRIVNDAGVIYGHWLEGTGSRNAPVTRFKGYASFRRTKQELEAKVPELVEHAIAPYVERCN